MSWLSWIKGELESSKTIDLPPRGPVPQRRDSIMSEDSWLTVYRHRLQEDARAAERQRQERLQRAVDIQAEHERRRQELEAEATRRREHRRQREESFQQVRDALDQITGQGQLMTGASNFTVDTGRLSYQPSNTFYEIDFTKVNSIEDIGKVLEVICSQFKFTEQLVNDSGIRELVKRVER